MLCSVPVNDLNTVRKHDNIIYDGENEALKVGWAELTSQAESFPGEEWEAESVGEWEG